MLATYIFVDTDCLEQFRPLSDIDWRTLTASEEVILVISTPVIRQLNKHKDNAERQRLRDKAGSVLKMLKVCSADSSMQAIRQNVRLAFEHREPGIPLAEYDLSPEVEDDVIVACCIRQKLEMPSARVILATGDFGLQLKIEAHPELEVLSLPEDLRLPQVEDPVSRELRNAKAELERLRSSQPKLGLEFEDRNLFLKLSFPRSLEAIPSSDTIATMVAAERARHPLMFTSKPDVNNLGIGGAAILANLNLGFMAIPEEDIEKSNKRVSKYLSDCEMWLEDSVNYRNHSSMSAEIAIFLRNSGHVVGEDIDIHLHFPDGFELWESDEESDAPKRPVPPRRPVPLFERTLSMPHMYPSFHHSPLQTAFSPPPNASLVKIKKGNSYDVDFSVRKLKHGYSCSLPKLMLRFASPGDVVNFGVDYVIRASNLPIETAGKLHINSELKDA